MRKATDNLEKLKSSALSLEASTEGSIFDEDRFSHLVKSILQTQKELSEMLNLAKKVVNADSATLFVVESGNLILKASTESSIAGAEPITITEGYLSLVVKGKKPLILSRLKGRPFGIAYSGTKEIGSFLCVPVLDGDISVGVLAMESKREVAFGEREKIS